MIYIFQGGNHIVQFAVGKNRDMTIANERTKFKFVPLSLMFKPDVIKKLKALTEKMNDEEFEKYITSEFQKIGYTLKKKIEKLNAK